MCVLYVYTTDLDFCDPVFGFKSVSNHINPFSIVTYFLKNEYYIFWILQIGTLLRTFLECERRPYHFIASIFCSLCVDLTSNVFQFLFFFQVVVFFSVSKNPPQWDKGFDICSNIKSSYILKKNLDIKIHRKSHSTK